MSRIARLSEKGYRIAHNSELGFCGRGDKERQKKKKVVRSKIREPILSLDVLIESKMFRPVAVCIM